MIWWFLILAVSSGAILWVGISFYLYVRRHMKQAAGASGDAAGTPAAEPPTEDP